MSLAKDVGIVAMQCYFPKYYVDQSELEKHDKVSKGKYTIGLGQNKMSFVTDAEDVCSMALTALSKLTESFGISYSQIGRLEVATETIQDHSKSVKSFLMKVFEESGNYNVEGVDALNACYGATSALFNSAAWIESSDWEGKFAVVVAVDIAEYQKGPARPAGGCGVIAFALGPNAPLTLDKKCRFSHFKHVFDFYKPVLNSPFPVVDGHYSNDCYMEALDMCYKGYTKRYKENYGEEISVVRGGIDFFVFHSPYNKLVRKAFGRIIYNDFLLFKDDEFFDNERKTLMKFKQNDFRSRDLMKVLLSLSNKLYNKCVLPTTFFPVEMGNSYTASVYFGIFSFLSSIEDKDINLLKNKRIAVFSYGSGMTSSIFSFKFSAKQRIGSNQNGQKVELGLRKMVAEARLAKENLQLKREKKSSAFFESVMERKEDIYCMKSFEPENDVRKDVLKGAFYLVAKDEKGRRKYKINE